MTLDALPRKKFPKILGGKSEGFGDARFFLPDLLAGMRPGQADDVSTSAHSGQQIRRHDPEELANSPANGDL